MPRLHPPANPRFFELCTICTSGYLEATISMLPSGHPLFTIRMVTKVKSVRYNDSRQHLRTSIPFQWGIITVTFLVTFMDSVNHSWSRLNRKSRQPENPPEPFHISDSTAFEYLDHWEHRVSISPITGHPCRTTWTTHRSDKSPDSHRGPNRW